MLIVVDQGKVDNVDASYSVSTAINTAFTRIVNPPMAMKMLLSANRFKHGSSPDVSPSSSSSCSDTFLFFSKILLNFSLLTFLNDLLPSIVLRLRASCFQSSTSPDSSIRLFLSDSIFWCVLLYLPTRLD